MSKRILVVDDHSPTRTLIRSVLEAEKGANFTIVEAANGTECLMASDTKGPFDLILLDIKLPDMDGFQVCRALRHVDAHVPIVFVTAQGDLQDFQTARQAGGDSYLVKPIGRQALRAVVNLFTNVQRNKAPDAGAKQ
jgi:CheY-like chemotaxis protein